MKIKVCGIRTKQNLAFLETSGVDFVGFIFYSKSKRCFSAGDLDAEDLIRFDKKRVGVFVNESIEKIETIAKEYQLDYIQLHGDESPMFCQKLNSLGLKLFKAFSVKDSLPENLLAYQPHVAYFLFDTKGQNYGGNGTQFDWSVLDYYKLYTPFILSGGIGLEDVDRIKKLDHPQLFAIDVNSQFELEHGVKDEAKLNEFISELKK